VSLDGVEVHLVDSVDRAGDFLRWLSARDRVALDTECSGLDKDRDRVRLAQFGDAREAWAVPFERWGGVVAEAIRKFQGTYATHNGPMYDCPMLRREGIHVPPHKVDDTRFMLHVLESTGSLALKNVTRKMIDPRAAIGQQQLDDAMTRGGWDWATVPVDLEPYWFYGGVDTVLTYQLDELLRPRVQAEAPRAYELELAVSWIAERMERKGVRVDREYVERLSEQLTEHVVEVGKWCREHYGVSPGSSVQVIRRMQEDGVAFTKTTNGGSLSLDKYVLESLADVHPLAGPVLSRRQAEKLVSTYLRHYVELSERDGRIHPSINTVGGTDKNPFEPGGGSGVRTGRMSMNDPNLQNVPRRGPRGKALRRCFWPTEGNLWMKCDADQIEMRMIAHFSQDEGMIRAFMSEGDFFVNMARDLFAEPDFVKEDPRRDLVKNGGYCVPLDTQILTERGWLKHDEVKCGDRTLGFNVKTKKTEWTTITDVHHYGDVEIVKFGNQHRSFSATRNHRWLAVHDSTGEYGFVTTGDQPGSYHNVVLAAESSIGYLDVTDDEAEILGWVLSDGSIERGRFVGAPSQAGGRKISCKMTIFQVKPRRVAEIDDLLRDVPHRRYISKKMSKSGNPLVSWRINPAWARTLLDKVEVHDKNSFDPWKLATSLRDSQRRAMIRAINAADGCHQSNSPVTELVVALGYLTGHFARVSVRQPDGKGWMRNSIARVNYQRAFITGQRTTVSDPVIQDVWCVTTELGTWTMRQGRTPVLTGNSKIYGAGIDRFAATAGAPVEEASAFMRRFDALYPRVPAWIREVERLANGRLASEGVAYVRSPLTGRKHVADARRIYALVNYLIQGTAAELLKLKAVAVDHAGLGDYLTLFVHDEFDLDVPAGEVHEVGETLLDVVSDDTTLSVPLTWSVEVGPNWGECKELVAA
jgi:DNA polymerase I-like protein with 3'-5' exonuclease and polymerase domains